MSEDIKNFIAISIAYLVAFSITFTLITPLQNYLLVGIPNTISILFLPHGVRILAAHFYGWKSIPYLLPSAYFMYFIMTRVQGLHLDPITPTISIISAYMGVKLTMIFTRLSHSNFDFVSWKWILLAGFLGSIINGLGHGLAQSEFSLSSQILGYAIGDVAGQFTLMLCLIFYFRFIQKSEQA